MADDTTRGPDDGAGPSLEPPRLLGRRRRTRVGDPAPVTSSARPAPSAEPAATPEPDQAPAPDPVREATTTARFQDSGTTVTEPVSTTTDGAAPPDATPPAPRSRRRPSFTFRLPTRVAGLLVGLAVGTLLLLLVQLGQEACRAASGTTSCGPAPGMIGSVLIFVLGVVAGAYLLKLTGVPDSGSTSFLAVGMTALVALLFLGGQLQEWWMVLVIPGLSAFWFLVAAWVTTTFVDADDI